MTSYINSVKYAEDGTFDFRSTREREMDPAMTAYITTSSNSISSVEVKVDKTSRRRSAAGAKDRIERR
jgi:hypothetical protein